MFADVAHMPHAALWHGNTNSAKRNINRCQGKLASIWPYADCKHCEHGCHKLPRSTPKFKAVITRTFRLGTASFIRLSGLYTALFSSAVMHLAYGSSSHASLLRPCRCQKGLLILHARPKQRHRRSVVFADASAADRLAEVCCRFVQNMQLVKSLSASCDLQVADTLRLKSVKLQQLVQEEDYQQARYSSELVMHSLCLVYHRSSICGLCTNFMHDYRQHSNEIASHSWSWKEDG